MFCLLGSKASVAQTTLFLEDFTSQTLPAGWTNDSAGLPAVDLWLMDNPFQRGISGAGFDNKFVIFDSDMRSVNDNVDENASLTTADINISSATGALYLEMDEQYRELAGPFTDGSSRRIEYSTNSGSTWTTLVYDSMNVGYPDTMDAVHSIYPLPVSGAATLKLRFTWVGSWDWWWAFDNLEVVDYPVACTTPPNPGTASSDISNACVFDFITLTATGADSATGINYQWQVSTDNINWTDLPSATNSVFTFTGQAVASHYRFNVTCSGQTVSSNVIDITQYICYCIPNYNIGCDALTKVQINTLINDSTECNGNVNNYISYPPTGTLTTSLGTGDYYDLTIASGLGTGNHSAGVWFDFNNDGDFQDAGEYFHISDSIPESSADFVTTINVPNNALLGPTRMRVRYIYDDITTATSDCIDESYGETEDYTIEVILGTSVKNNPLQAIKVFPVPAHDRISIQSPIAGAMDITILDQTGRVCKSVYSSTNSIEINTSDLSAGVYFVRFDSEKYTITKKIILN